jgi:hypothetical protein
MNHWHGTACVLAALTLALCGCGATPPQAPLAQAKKLDASLSGISTACGLTYQTTAFAQPGQADLSSFESTAKTQARKLASVYARNPAWIYQGETVGKIVHDAVGMLGACGLTQAQKALERQISSSQPKS